MLPKTVQDAITVTKLLGFRYLWVDSLCIIQDSNEDKSKEIDRMGNIYLHSHLTISASRAAEATAGFLDARSYNYDIQLPARMNKTIPEITTAQRDKPVDTTASLPLVFSNGENAIVTIRRVLISPFRFEPVNTRAWTVQERMLSPRTLSFGSSLTYCQHEHKIDTCTGDSITYTDAAPSTSQHHRPKISTAILQRYGEL